MLRKKLLGVRAEHRRQAVHAVSVVQRIFADEGLHGVKEKLILLLLVQFRISVRELV